MLEMVSERNNAPLYTAVRTVTVGVSMIFPVFSITITQSDITPIRVAQGYAALLEPLEDCHNRAALARIVFANLMERWIDTGQAGKRNRSAPAFGQNHLGQRQRVSPVLILCTHRCTIVEQQDG